jgi:aspartate carbamoyltransferase regulatory subunit
MTEFTGSPSKKGLIVSPIENGTVLDHLPPGKGVMIAKMLGLMEGSVVIIGQNLRSTKHGKKDLIKVENRFLTEEECSEIAIVAPNATVNIIRGFAIIEKRNVVVPDIVEGVALCANANCITNKERVRPRLKTVGRSPTVMVCTYCGFEARGEDLKLR